METKNELQEKIKEALKTIYDPEIPVDIYELGLIYDIEIDRENNVKILMTLTSPFCPVADVLAQKVRDEIKAIPAVEKVDVEITFDPAWTPEKMSESARLQLGFK
jgi:FeS assembly SUF system protein